MKMYIISYLGDTEETQQRRTYYHTRQVDWSLAQGLDVEVLAQEYPAGTQDSRVYTIPSGRMMPAEARNILLERFYNSQEDFAIFADNDSVLYEGEKYGDSSQFVRRFVNTPIQNLRQVDLFFPVNPGKVPFTADMTKRKQIYEENWYFQRNVDSKGSFLVLKNLRKHYGNPVYFDHETFQDQGVMTSHEDVDFGLQMLSNGYSCYQCKNIILRELGSHHSTWAHNQMRGASQMLGKQKLQEKYQIPMNRAGHFQYDHIYARSQRPQVLMVPKRLSGLNLL